MHAAISIPSPSLGTRATRTSSGAEAARSADSGRSVLTRMMSEPQGSGGPSMCRENSRIGSSTIICKHDPPKALSEQRLARSQSGVRYISSGGSEVNDQSQTKARQLPDKSASTARRSIREREHGMCSNLQLSIDVGA